jgi:hypothetical protein
MSGNAIWAFAGTLRANWFAAMSGGFSVPFTAAAVYFDSKYAHVIFGALALASLYFAAYRIWKSEWEKAVVLQVKLNREFPAERDVGIGEAVGYICFREWGHNFKACAGSTHVSGGKEYDDLLQSFADGKIPVWGKRENYGVHEPISKEYWFNNRIDWFSLLRDEPNTEPTSAAFKGDSYSSLMTSRATVERYWPAMGGTGPRALSALRISFGMVEAYSSAEGSNLYQLKRAFSLKLENIGQKALSSCRAIIESCDVPSALTFPITLREGITLAPGDHLFIPLVRYGEAMQPEKHNCPDSFATLILPDEKPFISVGENALLRLKATGIDTPSHIAQCRIWISENGKLQIQNEWPR